METSHYKVTVSRLRARLSITISYNTLKGEMTVEGYPDVRFAFFFCIYKWFSTKFNLIACEMNFILLFLQIRIAMASIGAIKTDETDEKLLQDSVRLV